MGFFVAPVGAQRMERRLANKSPNMAGLTSGGRATGWVKQHVYAWVNARIKGQPWTPGAMPQWPEILRKREVLAIIGLSNVRLWQLEQEGKFPKRIKLTEGGDAAA